MTIRMPTLLAAAGLAVAAGQTAPTLHSGIDALNHRRVAALEQSPPSTGSVVEAVASAVEQRYVFPEIGDRIAADMRQRAGEGVYASLTGGQLADALTHDLRSLNGDRHLYVQYSRAAPHPPQPADPSGSFPARRRPPRTSCGAATTTSIVWSGSTAMSATSRSAGSSACRKKPSRRRPPQWRSCGDGRDDCRRPIRTWRRRPHGRSHRQLLLRQANDDAVDLLGSLNAAIKRSTLETCPGGAAPDVPLYVLISRDTGSAAEDFAFLLQQTGRATLVGDRTAGAGHTNAILAIGGGYSVSVSMAAPTTRDQPGMGRHRRSAGRKAPPVDASTSPTARADDIDRENQRSRS